MSPADTVISLINDLRNARRLLGPDWQKRIAAALQLGKLRAGEAVPDLAAAVDDPKAPAELRRAAAIALGQIANRPAAEALAQRLGLPDIGTEVANALGQIEPDCRWPALLQVLSQKPNDAVESARQLLSALPDLPARLLAALDDSSLQAVARKELSALKTQALPALSAALESPNLLQARTAVELLTKMGQDALPSLLAALAGQSVASAAVCDSLVSFGEAAVPGLKQLLTGSDPRAAEHAAPVLQRIGLPAVQPLIDCLVHDSPDVRNRVAKILVSQNDPLSHLLTPDLTAGLEAGQAPRMCTVGEHEGGDYPTIEAALAAVPPAALVRLQPGCHLLSHPMVLQQSLALMGSGRDVCTVACDGEEYVIQVPEGCRLGASGITFEHRDRHFASVIEVAGGTVELYRCACQGGVINEDVFSEGLLEQRRFSCIRRRPGGNEKIARAFVIPDVLRAGSGLWLHGPARALVTECSFVSNGCDGVGTEDEAQVELMGNKLEGNWIAGMSLCGGTKGRVANNECLHNGEHGIAVRSGVERSDEDLLIGDNTCRQNKGVGIGFWQHAHGTARGNHCIGGDGQRHGLYASEEARPVFEKNISEGHELGGIAYYKGAAGMARFNTCRRNGAGILAWDAAHPWLFDNDCSDNKDGLVFMDESAPNAIGNTCRRCIEDGIQVCGHAHPTLERNTVSDNKRVGILYLNAAAGVARGNVCSGNEIGILLGGESRPTLTDNQCDGNRQAPIARAG